MATKATPQGVVEPPKKEEALVPAQPASLSTKEQAPEWMKRGSRGTEDVGQDDLILPRIALAQALTPQKKKADPRYIQGLDEGMLFNTVTGEIYGTRIKVIPLFFFKQRMKFEDIDKGGGLLCISVNSKNGGQLHPSDCATCPHNQWKEGDPPECNLLDNFAVLLPDHDLELGVISMKSTSIKVAKQWNSLIRLSQRDMFAKSYLVEVVNETKHNNTYGQWKVTPIGWVDQALYESAEQFFNDLRTRDIKIDTTGIGDDEDTEFNPHKTGKEERF